MWLALLHHARLQEFWAKELPRDSHELLRDIIPHTWVLDSTPSPPHTVIPDLRVGGRVVSQWSDLLHLSKKERELVIKPSGFTEDAQQSKGVTIGHDVAESDWQAALESAGCCCGHIITSSATKFVWRGHSVCSAQPIRRFFTA
jgi:hypothetical protein